MEQKFKMTVTANLADGSEINDMEVIQPIPADDIGYRAWALARTAAAALALETDSKPQTITSLVIVAVVA